MTGSQIWQQKINNKSGWKLNLKQISWSKISRPQGFLRIWKKKTSVHFLKKNMEIKLNNSKSIKGQKAKMMADLPNANEPNVLKP